MRARLAFYGSTPAYRVVLDAHGWGDLQPELNTLSKRGDWATMASLITDEMVDELCVVGTPDEIPAEIATRVTATSSQRISFDVPGATADQIAAAQSRHLMRDRSSQRLIMRVSPQPASDVADRESSSESGGRPGAW